MKIKNPTPMLVKEKTTEEDYQEYFAKEHIKPTPLHKKLYQRNLIKKTHPRMTWRDMLVILDGNDTLIRYFIVAIWILIVVASGLSYIKYK